METPQGWHLSLSPICSRFIETVGKLRATQAGFRSSASRGTCGCRGGALTFHTHTHAHTHTHVRTHAHTHTHTLLLHHLWVPFLPLLNAVPPPVCCFPPVSYKYFELQHTYPQYNILLTINFCVRQSTTPPRTPSPT